MSNGYDTLLHVQDSVLTFQETRAAITFLNKTSFEAYRVMDGFSFLRVHNCLEPSQAAPLIALLPVL